MTNDTADRMIAGPQIFGTVGNTTLIFLRALLIPPIRLNLKDMTPAEITAYSKGFQTAEADGSQKDWG
jgi:hypothetical protein